MIIASSLFNRYNQTTTKGWVHLLAIAGYPRVFSTVPTRVPGQYPWIDSLEGGGITVDELSGTAQRDALVVRVLDKDGAFTTDLESYILDGCAATIYTGFNDIPQSEFLTAQTLIVDRIDVAERGTAYDISLRDATLQLNNLIYTVADNGFTTSSDNHRTLRMNPMDIVADALENELGFDPSALNSTVINAYKNSIFAGLLMDFALDTAPQAKEFLETEIMKAMFGWAFWNNLGQYTPHFHTNRDAPTIAMALDANIIQSPLPVMTAGDYYNLMTYRLDYDGQNYLTEVDSIYGPGATRYGLPAQQIIQSKGLRSPLGGALYSRLMAWTLFERQGFRPGLLDLDLDWRGIVLDPGDVVSVTHPLIKNKLAGVGYLAGELFEVHGIKPDWQSGKVSLNLLDVNFLADGPYAIAPDVTPDWPGASPTQKADYMFVASDATGEYSDGTPGHPIYP